MDQKTKPKLSFWQIWNMSFGFLGIQFGFALQNANTSRIFEKMGAAVEDISILWIAAPVTGLIVQPIVGYLSDRTWNRLGRRRPYFLVGAVLSSIALILMPNSPTLWFAAGMLWIMDASINISMEPFRAFVGDNLPDEQRTLGFAMQSFFIGIGAVVGSMLPWIFTNWLDISNTAPEGMIAPSVKWSFYLGAIVFFLAVMWTVFTSKEYSPDELAAFEGVEEDHEDHALQGEGLKRQQKVGLGFVLFGAVITALVYLANMDKQVYILGIGVIITGLLFLLASSFNRSGRTSGFTTIMNDLLNMPLLMKQLAVVQFFSWFALFAMWIYSTSAVTSHVYGTTDTESQLYNDGADWVSVLFAVYNGVAALIALSIPLLSKKIGRKATHTVCLIAGGLGLISVFFINDPTLLIISMVGVGIAWASILAVPYAMLSGALPASKMGYYMGVFNFFIVIPQLVAATILGAMVKGLFNSEPIYALIVGGVSMILAGLFTLRVADKETIRV